MRKIIEIIRGLLFGREGKGLIADHVAAFTNKYRIPSQWDNPEWRAGYYEATWER